MSVLYRLTPACVALAAAGAVQAQHFSYSGENGPDHWAELGPDFAACEAGKSQSPINIDRAENVSLTPLEFDYSTVALEFVNNGHAVQANYAAGSTLTEEYHDNAPYRAHVNYAAGSTLDHLDETFELKQFHFHAPSEHQIDGKNLPAEIHFVHAGDEGHLAVVAVLVTEGAAHPTVSKLWEHLPDEEDEKNELTGQIRAPDLLPASTDYRYYHGSLTTPPCTEGVRWLVIKQPITMSAEQLEALRKAIGFANNRPVQQLHGRVVFE